MWIVLDSSGEGKVKDNPQLQGESRDMAQSMPCFTMRTAALTAFIVAHALAQQGPDSEFIAAEIRAVSPNAERSLDGGGFPGSDRYELRGATIVDMVAQAWGVSADRVVSGSGGSTEHFNVLASFAPGTPSDRLNGMLRNLLATR